MGAVGADHGTPQLPAAASGGELAAEAMPRCGSTCSSHEFEEPTTGAMMAIADRFSN